MNAGPDRTSVSLSALIVEIFAEHPEDSALRPLVVVPDPASSRFAGPSERLGGPS